MEEEEEIFVSPGVIETATGDLLRTGFCDFENDGTFDPETETIREDIPEGAIIKDHYSGLDYHQWDGENFVSIVCYGHEIKSDIHPSISNKDLLAIDYKQELKDGVSYTPEYVIKTNGLDSGCLEKTTYYRGYVDEQDKGTKVLEVDETYEIDDSEPSEVNSAKSCISRVKTWKHYKEDGSLDESKTKTKDKLYNTRRKKHIEGIRRRQNIQEQLIDNVALAGILSGEFTDEGDAFDKLVALQEGNEIAFSSWVNSGRGSIYDDITNDSTAWLANTVADNASTQAMCPHMIGMTYKAYIVDKLKGDIA